ncbi:hypothetical protein [Bilifractor sp. HCP3S3_D3]|uniref:hypothetical protein n=1 Tax=Bilifractor sp. HCP3S3_D3 TaxID=3438907 RepID=UPI003F8B9B39
MKLNRKFSKKETVLILILTFALLGFIYYFFTYDYLESQLRSYDTADLDSQITLEQKRAAMISQMKQDIANGTVAYSGEVATYNNLSNEMTELNNIFSGTSVYNFDFAEPEATDNTVRRNINITFTSNSYAEAEKIISSLYSCRYRCLISDLDIAAGSDSGVLQSGPVSVSMKVTFFETLQGATDTSGIIVDSSSDESQTDDTTSSSAASY